MADVRKVLGQIAPAAKSETALYTAPFSANLNIIVTNRSDADSVVSIRIAVADAAVNDKQYIAKDFKVPGNDFVEFNDLEVQATDVIYATAGNAEMSIQAFGAEATS